MENLRLLSITDEREAKDLRKFYTASFQDPNNPFAKTVSRNFWQQKNAAGEPVWKGADPSQVKPFIGKLIPGRISTQKVVPYEVTSTNGEARTANTYTTVILGAELEEQVFKSMGHPLATTEEVTAPVVNAIEEIVIE